MRNPKEAEAVRIKTADEILQELCETTSVKDLKQFLTIFFINTVQDKSWSDEYMNDISLNFQLLIEMLHKVEDYELTLCA